MRLSRNGARDQEVGTLAELEEAIRDLGARRREFVVLRRDGHQWAQAAGSSARGFVVEVCEGGKHLESCRSDLTHAEAQALLGAWLEGGDAWRAGMEWQPGVGDPASGARGGWRPVTYRHATFVFALALAGDFVRQQARRSAGRYDSVKGEVVAVKRVSASRGQYSLLATVRWTPDGRPALLNDRMPSSTKVGALVWVWFDPSQPIQTATTFNPEAKGGSLALMAYAVAAVVALLALKLLADAYRNERAGRSPTRG